MNKIFKIDFGLYLLGIFTILTGFGLHIAGHGYSHQVWEVWCIIHSVVSVLFTVLVVNSNPVSEVKTILRTSL